MIPGKDGIEACEATKIRADAIESPAIAWKSSIYGSLVSLNCQLLSGQNSFAKLF
ncbi:MAG: hypothetical protein F6K28_61110 [Microcoleus sp. SIO2G3]|nr:hypothetical protein [Microcoleus sp. SIO2G3]